MCIAVLQCKARRCENVLLRLTPLLPRCQHTTPRTLQSLAMLRNAVQIVLAENALGDAARHWEALRWSGGPHLD
jgi:hypothetical protein